MKHADRLAEKVVERLLGEEKAGKTLILEWPDTASYIWGDPIEIDGEELVGGCDVRDYNEHFPEGPHYETSDGRLIKIGQWTATEADVKAALKEAFEADGYPFEAMVIYTSTNSRGKAYKALCDACGMSPDEVEDQATTVLGLAEEEILKDMPRVLMALNNKSAS